MRTRRKNPSLKNAFQSFADIHNVKKSMNRINRLFQGGKAWTSNDMIPFLREFYASIQHGHKQNSHLFMQLPKVDVSKIRLIATKLSAIQKTELENDFVIAIIYFLILTNNNKPFKKFVKIYFSFNIEPITNSVIRTLFTSNYSAEVIGGGYVNDPYKWFITSFLAFCYSTLLFTQMNNYIRDTYKKSDYYNIVNEGKDIFEKCKFDKSLYKATTKWEATIQNIYETFFSEDVADIQHLTKYLNHCFIRDHTFKEEYGFTSEPATLFTSLKALPAPSVETEPKLPVDVVLPTSREILQTKNTKNDVLQKTWITSEKVSELDNEKHLITFLYGKNPELFKNMETILNKDLQPLKTRREQYEYLKRIANYDMHQFEIHFFEENEVYNLKNVAYNLMNHIKNYKSIYDYFMTKEGLNYLALSLSGGNVLNIIYNEYQRSLNTLLHEYDMKLSEANMRINNILLDTDKIVNLFKTNLYNVWGMITSFFSFMFSIIAIMRKLSTTKTLEKSSSLRLINGLQDTSPKGPKPKRVSRKRIK